MNVVTAKELSQIFKVSDSTIYNLALSGKLPAFRIGGAWRFDLDEICALFKKSIAGMKISDVKNPHG